MSIKSPVHDSSHRDYGLECEAALQLSVSDLIDNAITAGRQPTTVHDAVKRLLVKEQIAYVVDSDPADDPI